MNSVCVPWGDGGRGTILVIVRTVASTLRSDPDDSVASVALSTLCALDAIVTPRAPALLIPSRVSEGDRANTMNAVDIVDGIKKATDNINASKDDVKQTKKRKKVDVEQPKITKAADDSLICGSTATGNTSNNHSKRDDEPNSSDSAPTLHDKIIDPNLGDAMDANTRENTSNLGTIDERDHAGEANATVQPDSNFKDQIGVSALIDNSKIHEQERNLESLGTIGEDYNSPDDSSMDDFPEIVDEGPDEEDRV